MARHADNLSYGDELATQRVIPPDVVNSMVAACGIARRVAYLINIEHLEEKIYPRRAASGSETAGENSNSQGYPELGADELFEEAIASLGLSLEEVISLWDLFLSASAGAKRHYQRLTFEQRLESADDGGEPVPAERRAIKIQESNQERM